MIDTTTFKYNNYSIDQILKMLTTTSVSDKRTFNFASNIFDFIFRAGALNFNTEESPIQGVL